MSYSSLDESVTDYGNVSGWFFNDDNDIESSDFLEVALSELFVQELELDWTDVIRNADFWHGVDGNAW